jgi:phosphomannomutase
MRWVEDADRVIVVDEREGETHILRGVEAAVWAG